MALTRLQQLAAVVESDEGVLEPTLFDPANVSFLVSDPTLELNVPIGTRVPAAFFSHAW